MSPLVANNLIFSETQWFYRRWWWLLLAVTLLLAALTGGALLTKAKPLAITILALANLPLLVILWLPRLKVRLDTEGIHYQFIPFLNRWRHWPWTEFRQVFPRTYSPLGDFGGWGLRGLPGNLAYNVWGPYGLQLIFRSGDRLLLGTQRPADLQITLAALHAADATRPIGLQP